VSDDPQDATRTDRSRVGDPFATPPTSPAPSTSPASSASSASSASPTSPTSSDSPTSSYIARRSTTGRARRRAPARRPVPWVMRQQRHSSSTPAARPRRSGRKHAHPPASAASPAPAIIEIDRDRA